MTDRGERICRLLVIVAALAVIIFAANGRPLAASIAAGTLVMLALLPSVVRRLI